MTARCARAGTWSTTSAQLLSFHFMLNALRAGTIVAVVAGAIGYFMVLRRQSFAGHTLAVVGFPGAAGATWLGVNAAFGYFGVLHRRRAGDRRAARRRPGARAVGAGDESAAIGTVQGFALACGFLFVSLYHGFLSGLNGLLFGAIIGVTDDQVLILLVVGVACLLVLALIGRPLLFASVDADVARPAACRSRLLVGASSWCCSASRRRAPARSPAACWCSRCSSPRPRPPAG